MKKIVKKKENASKKNILILLAIITIVGICTKNIFAYGNKPTEEYTVEYNDTLWSIAKNIVVRSENENLNIQKVVYEIKKINNMESSDIFMGQELIIPVY